MSNFLSEAFRKLEGLNEDTFEITKDGLKKLDKFMEEDDNVEQEEITVYDMWGEDTEKEQEEKSIVGKIILECDSCHSLTFLGDDEVVIDDETNSANVDMECPYCHSMNGFAVVGKVCPTGEEKDEEEVEEKEEIDESCKSKKTKNELFDANLDLSNFGGQGNDVSVLSPGGGLSKMLPVGEELDDEDNERKQKRKDRRKARRDVRRAKRTNEPVDESVKKKMNESSKDNVIWSSTAYRDWVWDASDEELRDTLIDIKGLDDEEIADMSRESMEDALIDIGIDQDYEVLVGSVLPEIEKQCKDGYLYLTGDYQRWNGSRSVAKVIKAEDLTRLLYPNYDANTEIRSDNGNLYYTEYSHDAPMGGTSIYLYSVKDNDAKEKLDDYIDNEDFFGNKKNLSYEDIETLIENKVLTPVKNVFNESFTRRKKRKNIKESKSKSVKNEDHQADNVLTKYQRWVDYDMKKYGKISKITQKALDKAGFEVVKDDHGDYEVIANTNESLNLGEKRIGKTKQIKVLQGNYGYGWDDLVEYEMDDMSSKEDYKSYRENEPQYSHRIIYRRVPNPEYQKENESLNEDNYRGSKDVEFVSHGQWADPDLVYNGYTFNYWDVEDALWSMFLEDTGHKDSESDDPKVEEEFDKYVQDNVVSYLEDAIAGGYFAKGKKSWHESLNKKDVNEAPIYDLDNRFDSRQSFYGKAKVDTGDKGDKNRLYSYNTLVAEIKDGKPVVYGTYSATTLRHIKEWLKQLGFKAENKAQIERDYLVKNESLKEDLSYGELASISNEWEKFKKDTGRSDAESAREFIEKKYKKEYDDEEREDIFGYISTLEESFKDVTITTDDTHMEMTSDENGKVTVTTEPVCKECEEEKEEVIEPLTDEDKVEIEKKSFDNENDDEVEVDFDEFDEETFESLTESFLKKTYNNVKSFKVNEEKDSGVSVTKDGKIIVEGKITFNSGAQKDTKFIFEGHQATKRGKVKLIGENAQITNGKKAFTITGSINNKKLVVESLNYNYRQKNPITHKADRIYGTVKNK